VLAPFCTPEFELENNAVYEKHSRRSLWYRKTGKKLKKKTRSVRMFVRAEYSGCSGPNRGDELEIGRQSKQVWWGIKGVSFSKFDQILWEKRSLLREQRGSHASTCRR
jgi:hypothetical protein